MKWFKLLFTIYGIYIIVDFVMIEYDKSAKKITATTNAQIYLDALNFQNTKPDCGRDPLYGKHSMCVTDPDMLGAMLLRCRTDRVMKESPLSACEREFNDER
jgi:hypothetical protein